MLMTRRRHPVSAVAGGKPNGRNTWKLRPHDRSAPFEGFHRSTLPDLLKKKPDLQS
jgi:citronellol/citronellal dehydrogenase